MFSLEWPAQGDWVGHPFPALRSPQCVTGGHGRCSVSDGTVPFHRERPEETEKMILNVQNNPKTAILSKRGYPSLGRVQRNRLEESMTKKCEFSVAWPGPPAAVVP
jgi:hypothetical protein